MSTSCSSSEPNTVGGAGESTTETNSSRELKIFKKVLRDPVLRAPFQEFLEQQFCAENLNFYLAVEQYKEINDFQERVTFGKRIYDRYFAMNSTEPVNIDNSTSKRIRETVNSGAFPKDTYDVAQYQILHLLKYDCWPRFLRSTSNIQPTFTDEELAADEDEKNGPSQPASTTNTSEFGESSSQQAPQSQAVSVCVTKEKRKSLLWHGLDRFSRRLRRGESSAPTNADEADASGSGSSLQAAAGRGVVGSAGSKRRYIFAASKQYSMPVEMTSPVKKNSLSPTHLRRRHVEPKQCQLMVGDQFNTETVVLDDPTMSVRRWTQEMAEQQGMDKYLTEVVDAETGSTIDPARQAIDALQSRALRLVPVVSFVVEFLPPNYSFKNPSSTPTKMLCVRARHSLSTGAVLRPLLLKYAIDINIAKIVCNGSPEPIKRSCSIGLMGGKTLTVMTDTQFAERMSSGKNCLSTRDQCIGQQCNFLFESNFKFHQHGDIAYCEIPPDNERNRHAHAQHHEAQYSSHQQKDHSISLFNKFVRKASHAVTKNDQSSSNNTKAEKKAPKPSPMVTKSTQEVDKSVNGNNAPSTSRPSAPVEPANLIPHNPTTSNSLPATPAVRHPAIFSTKVGNETTPSSPTTSPEPTAPEGAASSRENYTESLEESASAVRISAPPTPPQSKAPNISAEAPRDSTWQPAAYV
ncbi:unnamed protein product [Caenorhabditis bovis]|uniref:RGS domain-containing protein n=1 Tax=Caenorhabditis bovis TaxID=2654633 RepID=A0A8S1EC73_9PELO|nr:unnamed protein product [Caenorhabditis bovis]